MNFLQSNNLKKLLVFLLAFPLIINGIAFQTAKADIPFECDGITDSEQTKGWIITIIEENISSASDTVGGQTSENVLNCFRINTKTTTDGVEKITPTYGTSCTSSETVICQRVQVFFAQSGADLLYAYISRIYRWAAGTIGIVAVLFLTWGGIEMSTAGGDQGKIEKAKERIMQSLGGLVILFLSALILYTINPNFFTIS